jgi:5-methylcytosine-specific restriction enzyme A
MPRDAGRPCSHPGCPNLVHDRNRRFCDEHQKEEWRRQDRNRGTSAERGYDATWRKVRDDYLKVYPHCEICGGMATEVHHVIPISQGGDNSPSNLQAVCHACHMRIEINRGTTFGGHKGRG